MKYVFTRDVDLYKIVVYCAKLDAELDPKNK